MREKTVLLSISMLVSGRDDMKKSLRSLGCFKDAFPCEIILVDTGCNIEQRTLAEQYADKIIDFEWCNDFAAARNAGLREAKGEWFLYLDDDEWFEEAKEILSFFQSGEYKKFNAASYVVRNYFDFEGLRYEDAYLIRMVKLEPETRFVGKIHECLQPIREPIKRLADIAEHYGYAFRNEAERETHFDRNIEPLREMRKQYPGEARWIALLAQEYLSERDYENTFETCRTGLEECRLKGEYGNEYASTLFYAAIYALILISLECMEKYEEEERWLNDVLSQPFAKLEALEPTIAFYCFMGARLFCVKKKYEVSRDFLRRYFDYAYKWKDDRETIARGTVLVTAGVFQTNIVNGTLMCVEALIRLEDYAFAKEAFYLLDWKDKKLLRQDIWERNILDACCSVTYHALWVEMLQTLCCRENGMKEMLVVFLEREQTYRQNDERVKLARLRRLVSELECDHRYVLYTKILWEVEKGDVGSQVRSKKVEALFEQLFAKCPEEVLWVRDEVWDVAEQLGISLEKMLLGMDFLVWKQGLEQWVQEASLGEICSWKKRLKAWKSREDIHYDYAALKCSEGILFHYDEVILGGLGAQEKEELEQLLWRYSDCAMKYYASFLEKEMVREASDTLPEDFQLALLLQRIKTYQEQGRDKEVLSCLRKCLGLYSPLEAVVGDYAKRCRDEIQVKNQKEKDERKEFNDIIKALKAEARLRIEKREYGIAKEILSQLEKYVVEDEEINRLVKQLENQKD